METIVRYNEDALYKLRRRKIALGEMKGEITGYPSIDMPWLKYYTEEQILAPIPNMSALEYLKILNNNNLNLPAIEFLGKQITYLELFKKINDTTKSLHALGVKPGEIVTIMLPACPEEVFLFYAIDQIGACANFVFPGTPLNEVEHNMEEFNSRKLIILDDILMQPNNLVNNSKYNIVTTSLTGEHKVKGKNIYTWDTFDKLSKYVEMPIYKRNQEEPLFIAKTGGSTGKPKAVVINDRGFNLQVQQHLNTSQNYEAGDRWLRLWPLFSASAAVSSNHLPLCSGMHMIIEPYFTLENIDEIILKHKPSHMPFIGSGIDFLIKSPRIQKEGLSFMKSLGVGGEAISEETELKANEFLSSYNIEENVRIGYGMTENSSGAAARFNKETSALGSTGIPQLNTVIAVFNPETDEELKYGEEGEICVLSSTFMLGYYNDPEATNSVLKKHKDGRTWLHSGDIGHMDQDGKIYIKGRMKRVISLYIGNKIFPSELEKLIEIIDEVEKAVVVPELDLDHPGCVKPCCFITLNKTLSIEELKEKINNQFTGLADYVKIDTIYIRDELPKTAIGKIDLKELEEEAKTLSKKKQ